jgi:hypothetical protein
MCNNTWPDLGVVITVAGTQNLDWCDGRLMNTTAGISEERDG